VTGLILRPATLKDADAIASVHIAARRAAMPWLPDLHSDDETRAWIGDVVLPRQVVWVAVRDGQVAGVAALDGSVLEQLYVLPEAQGQGIGGALPRSSSRMALGTRRASRTCGTSGVPARSSPRSAAGRRAPNGPTRHR
jgi:GNAT superfamily N-acetyltransferase